MQDNHYYKNLNHNLLRTFYMVAKQQSITQAAQHLFVTQPTVSLQIQAVERMLEHQLFDRHGPKIVLTNYGLHLYRLVEPIISKLDTLKIDLEKSIGDIAHGEINIACGQTTSLYILPEYISRLQAIYPGIKVRIHNVTDGAELTQFVKDNKVDIAIGNLSKPSLDIIYKPFIEYNYSLITAKEHPLSKKKNIKLADIAKYKLILPPRTLSVWHMIDIAFNKANVQYFVGIETSGWEIVKKYVSLNLGVSIINNASITDRHHIEIIDMPHTIFPAKHYGLVMLKDKSNSPQCTAFIHLFYDFLDNNIID